MLTAEVVKYHLANVFLPKFTNLNGSGTVNHFCIQYSPSLFSGLGVAQMSCDSMFTWDISRCHLCLFVHLQVVIQLVQQWLAMNRKPKNLVVV